MRVLTEQEICKQGENSGCLVSVCMLAYNHEAYIRDALDGVLSQRGPFLVEVLIHDDASDDATADIIREYAARYPSVIRPVYQHDNQYSQGVKVSVEFNFPRIRGDLVAICECDDFWTDPDKLGVQVAALRAHPECGLCFHSAWRMDCSPAAQPNRLMGVYREGDGSVSAESVMLRTMGPIPTASCLVARDVFDEYVAFRQQHEYMTGDLYMQFFASRHHGAWYIDRPMSVYRWFSGSSWTRGYLSSPDHALLHERAVMRSYRDLDVHTRHAHRAVIQKILLMRMNWALQHSRDADPEEYQALCRQIRLMLRDALAPLARGSDKIYLYGTGVAAECVAGFFPPRRLAGILDRDPDKRGETFLGLPVCMPDDLAPCSPCSIIVTLFGRGQTVTDSLVGSGLFRAEWIVSLDPFLLPLVESGMPLGLGPNGA